MSEERSPKEVSGLLQLACAVHAMDPRTRHLLLDAARVLDEHAALRAELDALKEAARPVVDYYKWLSITEEDAFEPGEIIIGSSFQPVGEDNEAQLQRHRKHIEEIKDIGRRLKEEK